MKERTSKSRIRVVKRIIVSTISLFLIFSFTFNYKVENQIILANISHNKTDLLFTTLTTSSKGCVTITMLSNLSHEGFDGAIGIVVKDNYAYLTSLLTGESGILTVNVSNLTNPTAIKVGPGTGWLYDITIDGNFVYVANDQAGLSIFNVTDVNYPEKISQYDDGLGWAREVVVKDDLAFVADCSKGLDIVNVSDPLNPVQYSNCNYPDSNAWGVNITGNYAFIADAQIGLVVIDISDPKFPVKVGQYFEAYSHVDCRVAVKDDHAFVVSQSWGCKIIDVSDPTNPQIVIRDEDMCGMDIVIQNNIACIADGYDGIKIFDIRNVSKPVHLGTFDLSNIYGASYDLCLKDNILYVAQGTLDLIILELILDIDGDGLSDEDEINIYGTDPYNADSDNDAFSDFDEINFGTDPLDADTDDDLMPDGWEVDNLLNPLIKDDNLDPDQDELTNHEEYIHNTNPQLNDTDQDGLNDFEEVNIGSDGHITDPTNSDSDADGLLDGEEYTYSTNPNNSDSDEDGYSDYIEIQAGTDPNDPEDYPEETTPPSTTPSPTPTIELALYRSFIGFSLFFLFGISLVVFLNQRKKL